MRAPIACSAPGSPTLASISAASFPASGAKISLVMLATSIAVSMARLTFSSVPTTSPPRRCANRSASSVRQQQKPRRRGATPPARGGSRGEFEVSAFGEASHFLEHLVRKDVGTFLEDEEGRTPRRGVVKPVRGFLDHVADEHNRGNRLPGVLLTHVIEDPADLGLPRHAHDPAHRIRQLTCIVGPMARLAFFEAAVIDELDFKPADPARFREHLALQPYGGVPCRLAGSGGVEREDQPPAMGRLDLVEKGGNPLRVRSRQAIRHVPLLCPLCVQLTL